MNDVMGKRINFVLFIIKQHKLWNIKTYVT